MFEPAKISDAFITESRLDMLSAKLLFDKEIYSRAVYFAQQSSEKAIKSCLALRNIISGEHKVTVFFEEEFRNDFDSEVFAEILRNARELEVHGIKTRYPLFSRSDMPLWIPSQEYTEEDAREAIRKSSFILDSLEKFIKSQSP